MSYMDEPPPYKAGGIAAAAAYVVSRLIGLPLWLPVLLSLASFFVIGKLRPKANIVVRYAAGIVAGQALWMLIGGLVLPAELPGVLPDLIISAILIPWLIISLSKIPAFAMILYEAAGVALNGYVLTTVQGFDPSVGGLLLHLVMRITVIVLAGYSLRNGMTSPEAEIEGVDEVFS